MAEEREQGGAQTGGGAEGAGAPSDLPPAPGAVYAVTFGVALGRLGAALPFRNSFHLMGKGELRLAAGSVRIVGKSHRSFRPTYPADVTIPLEHVANVLLLGKGVRFDVREPGAPPRQVGFAAADEAQAEEIASRLPAARTEDFLRAVAEQADFHQRLEAVSPSALVTPTLVGINAAVFLAMALAGGGFVTMNPELAIRWGSNFGPLTMGGQWWRLLTCVFLHFGILHILFNMWVLYDVGRTAERLFGSGYYLALYLFSGLTGSLASLLWNPGVNSAGASGAIFGILGGTLAFLIQRDNRIPLVNLRRYRNSTLLFVFYSLIYGAGHAGIDNAAHLGGLTGGFVMGLLLSRPLDPEKRAAPAAGKIARAALAGGGILALMALPLVRPSREVREEQAFRRDMLRCWRCDAVTSETFAALLKKAKDGQISPQDFADKVDRELLPMWQELSARLSREPLDRRSKLRDLQQAYAEYAKTTERSIRLYADGVRGNSLATLQQADEAFEARKSLGKRIADLSAAAR